MSFRSDTDGMVVLSIKTKQRTSCTLYLIYATIRYDVLSKSAKFEALWRILVYVLVVVLYEWHKLLSYTDGTAAQQAYLYKCASCPLHQAAIGTRL